MEYKWYCLVNMYRFPFSKSVSFHSVSCLTVSGYCAMGRVSLFIPAGNKPGFYSTAGQTACLQ